MIDDLKLLRFWKSWAAATATEVLRETIGLEIYKNIAS